MGQRITIQPVTRIAGNAKITIQLDDKGDVADAKMHIIELRGFERFCIGRPVEMMPIITPRVCGVCSWAHQLASAKATDAVFGVEIPSAAKKLRELAYAAHMVSSHSLHFYFLAAPDFIMGPDADYSVRNVVGVIKAAPEVAKKAVRLRHTAQRIDEIMAGRAIHSPAAVPGGFSKPMKSEERGQLLEMAKECLDSAAFSIKFAKENIFPKYIDAVKTLGVINTGFLGIVAGDGSLNFYDGQLRMMQANGAAVDFAPASYLDYIIEHTEPWTYPKFPYDKRAGKIVLDPDNPVGVYRVGPLARINVCEKMTTPLAQIEFEEFRKTFGRPAQPSLLYHWARLIELLYAAERTVQLLEDPEITSPDVRRAVKPRAARGVGVVEAPRGTLIHDYETDENGMVKDINLIVATQHNNAAMNLVVKQTASRLIKGGKYDQGILNKIEMTVRPYDPCLSCATHTIYGGIAMQMDILDSDGRLVASLTN